MYDDDDDDQRLLQSRIVHAGVDDFVARGDFIASARVDKPLYNSYVAFHSLNNELLGINLVCKSHLKLLNVQPGYCGWYCNG